MLLQRILTAVIGIPLFVGIIVLGGWWLTALAALLSLLGFREFARLMQAAGVRVAAPVGYVVSLAFVLWSHGTAHGLLGRAGEPALGLLISLLVLSALTWQAFAAGHDVTGGMATVAGALYAGWLLGHLVLLRALPATGGAPLAGGLGYVAVAFACTWAADIAAFFTGRSLGRRKLAPALSPNKTVEGAMGGTAAAVLAGWVMGPTVGLAPWQGVLLGLAAGLAALTGDLIESSLKRWAGVKDSGRLLPGHGGVLDRFDSTLFVLPVLYYLILLGGLAA